MPISRDLYLIDARLSYLEQILAALGLINPVDPAPSDISRLGGGQIEAFRRPGPIVDPAVSDRVRLAESLLRRPPQGDPAATDRVRLAELLLRRPRPGDPAVSDRVRLAELLLRRPPHSDPPASDRVRLEVSTRYSPSGSPVCCTVGTRLPKILLALLQMNSRRRSERFPRISFGCVRSRGC
jgi:hypothetical protein